MRRSSHGTGARVLYCFSIASLVQPLAVHRDPAGCVSIRRQAAIVGAEGWTACVLDSLYADGNLHYTAEAWMAYVKDDQHFTPDEATHIESGGSAIMRQPAAQCGTAARGYHSLGRCKNFAELGHRMQKDRYPKEDA